jgi:glycosyltransferase involved in cell wall biosynthesis/2-polyprenyl-3-methyl-5-hydroxy-6-metoxy-1,4-benzoquinol methylase
VRICTIVARNYLPQARVLATSYAEHNNGDRCSVLLVDDPERIVDESREPFEVIRPEQLGIERYEGMAAMYDVTELATAVKPWLLGYLLGREQTPIAYFDPDIRFFDQIDEIAALTAGGEIVLTPHVAFRPVPRDDKKPSEMDLLAAGTYNLGFIALPPGETTEHLIAWWAERLRFDCVIEHAAGKFVDQRWFDLVTSVVPRHHILRDPGANVAYWNLHERDVRADGDRYTVNGEPLRFFHFSGFDPDRPYSLSKHQDRVRLPDEPVVTLLCDAYGVALRAAGFDRDGHAPWLYAELADGTPLTPRLRLMYNEGERARTFQLSPFTDAGTREFKAWCQSTADRGARHGLSRVALAVYDGRSDLQLTFPSLEGEDGARYARWISYHRRDATDLGLPPEWLPAPPPGAEEAPPSPEDAPWGVNVAGYLRSELGVGEAARTVITALDAQGVPVMPIHGTYVPNSRQGHAFAFLDPGAAQFPVNLICVNADQLPAFMADAGPRFSEGRYTIGFWWWEVTRFPDRSLGAFDLIDEVWVGSEHVAEALRQSSKVAVVKIRIPVTMAPIAPLSRAQLSMPEGYVFFFMFDFHSVIERKNPMAVIDAFRAAFPPGSGASLVIKCINHESKPDEYDRLRLTVGGHPDIHIVNRYVSAQEKDAMLAAADCYVSLHRSEGFGLTPAEAMYLGKPVIATGYSGNLEYMTPENSYLVDYTLRRIGAGNFPYPADGEWAEPDREHAARLMREVVENPLVAERRGRQAAADIRANFSPQAAGETMARRLEFVRAHLEAQKAVRHPGPPIPAPLGLRALQELIVRGPVPREGGRGGAARRLAHRAALRLMRPVIAHEREVGERLLSEVAATRRRAAAQVATVLAEIRHREAHDPVAGMVLGYRSANGSDDAEEHRAFEDVSRGPEEYVRERQREYISIIDGREPVLDFGCGRGEFLDLLRDAGVPFVGVDNDPGMVSRCHEKGHSEVIQADGLVYLRDVPDASLGAIFTAQVIEHLAEPELRELLALGREKLKPDGVLIAETVNPHSALESCRAAGFGAAYVFHPTGTGNFERDRFTRSALAVVASVSSDRDRVAD